MYEDDFFYDEDEMFYEEYFDDDFENAEFYEFRDALASLTSPR
jgi:hypothetical protein